MLSQEVLIAVCLSDDNLVIISTANFSGYLQSPALAVALTLCTVRCLSLNVVMPSTCSTSNNTTTAIPSSFSITACPFPSFSVSPISWISPLFSFSFFSDCSVLSVSPAELSIKTYAY